MMHDFEQHYVVDDKTLKTCTFGVDSFYIETVRRTQR